ncbi:serine hydroxymethyltransferase [Patescibacteria group bacterium]|nr:serine hydroxymethyltransferase [Patescibacteria group bacterium]MDE1946419.1 serine hydroxymethyltransferase [Patescibacteria group bacterium]MDE2011028.1 serine hydroxymethyltransferase [Patescibacteria group bacterium]MDE2233475.1 serine hydroxymethyltransferase [Patescibacteria group bacterium]
MKDIQVKKLIEAEKKRQKKVINLIASENYVSKDVLEALGSELTNKYAEGYPGRRYYGGNEIIDKTETLCIKRALELFKLDPNEWHANVQPLSGSPANLAVYTALSGSRTQSASGSGTFKIMGMKLDHGGHLTHGHKVSASGKFWTQVPYGLDATTETINYDQLMELAMNEKPAVVVSGYTAYPRIIDWIGMKEVANAAGALLMVDMSHIAGLVAGGAYPSPFPYADIVTTTTHKTLRGPRAAIVFARKDKRDKAGNPMELDKKIDKAVFPGLQGGPHANQIAAVAVALKEAAAPAFKKYAFQIVKNARVLADELHRRGWRLISGGTDSHLILVDTWNNGKKNSQGAGGISGKEASDRLEKAGIIVNKNTIPFDIRSPADPSGIRLGTAAETTRGRKEKDFKMIAKKIDGILGSQ